MTASYNKSKRAQFAERLTEVEAAAERPEPQKLLPESANFIYFIACLGPETPVKIGYSNDPLARLIELQIACPYQLHPIGVMPGSRRREKEIHWMLGMTRLRGEWFLPSDELNALIEAEVSPWSEMLALESRRKQR